MLNLYNYYEQPVQLPLYDSMYNGLVNLETDNISKWGISIKANDLEPVLHIIQQRPEDAYQYVVRILKHRWPEAEPYIKKDDDTWYDYKEAFKIRD